MKLAIVAFATLAALSTAGCSRHFVVERDTGRIDDQRSVMSSSDTAWTIVKKPAAAQAAEAERAPE